MLRETMLQVIRTYFAGFSQAVGDGWNRWWFTPRDPAALGALRIATGLLTSYWLVTLSLDLLLLFGEGGLLPSEVVWSLSSPDDPANWSYLHWMTSPAALWTAHLAAIAVTVLFTCGLFTRVTSVLTLVTFLATVHRGPMITGILEPVLAFTLFYLCLGPSGARFSLDYWRRGRVAQPQTTSAQPSVAANIATRLLQMHAALVYLMMGLTMLSSPNQSWWYGDSIWFLLARPESRIVDLMWLSDHVYLLNFWTHWIPAYELAFALLVWNRWARPLLLGLGIPHWGLLALVSGLAPFCLAMLALNLVFIPPHTTRRTTPMTSPNT